MFQHWYFRSNSSIISVGTRRIPSVDVVYESDTFAHRSTSIVVTQDY